MSLPLFKECAWDFESCRPIFRNGNPLIITGNDAVKVWAWKALKTVRTRRIIYSWNYGSEVQSLIGKNYSEALKSAEAIRYIREALEINPYIKGITDTLISFADNTLTIAVRIITVYGEVNVNV